MKTCCPSCLTTFRVTPDQLKARAGNVRCGQCDTVFNALDSLLDETNRPADSAPPAPAAGINGQNEGDDHVVLDPTLPRPIDADDDGDEPAAADDELSGEAAPALSEAEAQELGKATGLILPRETSEIPGYSKWSEVLVSELVPPDDKAMRWPFVVVALLLVLALVGQIVYRLRSEIAVALPSLRPALEALSHAVDADVPLPRHVDLVSIEVSDLQTDPTRGNLLVLHATLRNRAGYAMAYPSLELSLTDTQDAAIARRVFAPADYLSAKIPSDQPFAAQSELAVRLWIEARDIVAAGYRLYVFYP